MEKTLSKLEKYSILEHPPIPDEQFLSQIGRLKDRNDEIDASLLFAVAHDAVDFLITEDKGIHTKAGRLGLDERVLLVDQAAEIFTRLGQRRVPQHTLIEHLPVHNLQINDPFFNSLRKSYPTFDEWFVKISREGRCGWVLRERGRILALCIYKEEPDRADSDAIPLPSLKICTLKVADEVSGRRIAELFLKLSFQYTIKNHLCSTYFTAHSDQESLIGLMTDFGFVEIGMKGEEHILMKHMTPPKVIDHSTDSLNYAIKYYPHFMTEGNVKKFIIPIQPEFHNRIFPDCPGTQPRLCDFTEISPEGNTIKKAYICNAKTMEIHAGDVLLFYRSHDQRAITSIGIVERTIRTSNPSEIVRTVGNRTVYSFNEIRALASKHALVIIFRHMENLLKPVKHSVLSRSVGVKGPVQSIRRIDDDLFQRIMRLAR